MKKTKHTECNKVHSNHYRTVQEDVQIALDCLKSAPPCTVKYVYIPMFPNRDADIQNILEDFLR